MGAHNAGKRALGAYLWALGQTRRHGSGFAGAFAVHAHSVAAWLTALRELPAVSYTHLTLPTTPYV